MALQDFSSNLKLLCGYGKSVTDICKLSGINRQQFNRYLSGKTQPSLQTLRKICDFFGIEDHEIFLDHATFRQVIQLHPPQLGVQPNMLHDLVDEVAKIPSDLQKKNDKYIGFYHAHFQPDNQSQEILINLFSIYRIDHTYYTKQIERHKDGEYMLPKVIKYGGIMVPSDDRLFLYDRETKEGRRSFWSTILFASDYVSPNYLNGLSLGIVPETARSIQSYRTVFQYLGKKPNIKEALNRCGSYKNSDPSINDYIRQCVDNTIHPGDVSFSPRF